MSLFEVLAKWNRWGGAMLSGGERRDILSKVRLFLETKEIVVFTGPRRAGKTTILFQIMDLLTEKGVAPESMLHVNFEEPAFSPHLNVDLLEKIYKNYRENIFPVGKIYLFLDEIQNVAQWERWVRARNDTENIKIFITGSSSKLMSRELGTLLTGRHISFRVFPLSFKEFLRFEGIESPKQPLLLPARPEVHHALKKYLKWGGFPEVVISENELRKELLLKQYFDDILFKDVAIRHNIRDVMLLRGLAVHLLTHTASLVSFQRISKLFDVSLDLAHAYCDYLQEAFLIDFLPYYSLKVSERNRNPKKIHAIDLGFRQVLTLSNSLDIGHVIETAVYQGLMRQVQDGLFYINKGGEIDFVVREGNSVKKLIQVVCGNQDNIELKPHEISNLNDVAKLFPGSEKIVVLSHALGGDDKQKNDVKILPLWRFLLM
ncbi:MAG: ATP-binding protein [Gammaproteobacteria bacterium]|nr:ATP-binding protein [Gammaproteobacteria bacterium]